MMLAVFLIIVIIIAASGYGLLRRNRHSLRESKESILPAPEAFEGLFDNLNSQQFAAEEEQRRTAARRAALLERARQFDLQVLNETRADAGEYREVLTELLQQTFASQDKFQALVGHISQSKELRSNPQLAKTMMATWKTSPDNKSTAQMIHNAALSDDAALLERAIAIAAEALQNGALPKLSAQDLLALAESEYWVLAPEARRSGAGFTLKNSLADLRHRLATTRRG
jgi:hypothetical protein